MLRRSLLGTVLATAAAAGGGARAEDPADQVDVLLVLAIDASGSLSDKRLTLQREGHARAVESVAFLDAVAAGHHSCVALTALEWSNSGRQDQAVPWSVIEDASSAQAFGSALLRAPRPIPGFTSISGAIDVSSRLLARAPYAAARRVIDISGNGQNNDGRSAAAARDDALAQGATINGLPILDAVGDLDTYYAENVIGGPGAFMVVARDLGSFAQAILKKLTTEIATAPAMKANEARSATMARLQMPRWS
jgi:hypothetical protein